MDLGRSSLEDGRWDGWRGGRGKPVVCMAELSPDGQRMLVVGQQATVPDNELDSITRT